MSNHRILLISYPAQGHLNPALQLAENLLRLGAHVTFTTTLHMHRRMSNKPTHLPNLSFRPFSDGHDDGYDGAEDPNADHTLYTSEFNRRASEFMTDLAAAAVRAGNPFTCVVYTILSSWAAETARGIHLPAAMLWVQPAAMLDISYHYFHSYRPHIRDKITNEPSTPSVDLPGLPLLQPDRDLPLFLLDLDSSLNAFILTMFEEQFRVLDSEANKVRVLVNTFEALETEALKAVDEYEVIPIGPLVPSAFLEGGDSDSGDRSSGGDIFEREDGWAEWLDSKAEGSVVYVSFGSFWILPKKQMEELARALLDCGFPFLWVIKENERKEEGEELKYIEELEQSEKGKIVKWCRQVEVLSHASLGCFVTHCGWNSTMESLVSGVPLVALPRWTDQKTNAKLIEDVWKTGVRVDGRVNEEGVVEAGEIRRGLDLIMGSGSKGQELIKNAKKWKVLARDAGREGGSSHNNLRTFLDDIARS